MVGGLWGGLAGLVIGGAIGFFVPGGQVAGAVIAGGAVIAAATTAGIYHACLQTNHVYYYGHKFSLPDPFGGTPLRSM
jgi:hypothetical protein